MDLKDILAISGQSGLFKYLSEGRNGIIVESFANNKRMFFSATTKVSSLKDIAIYTETEELPLADVLKSIFEMENGGAAIDPKSSNEELKAYMAKVVPEYDRDIKKLVTWYGILRDNEMLNFDEEPAESEAPAEEENSEATPKVEKKETVKKTPQKPKPSGAKKPTTAKKTVTRSQPKAAK